VTGAPYSAVRSQQSVQTLADGTHHLTTKARDEGNAVWRDSAGRQRTETRLSPGEKARLCDSTLAMIEDPVAGYVYLLDSVDQVAYRMPLATTLPKSPRAPAAAPPQASPLEPTITTESLGEKIMFGITVTGTTRTLTYPMGSRIGNDRPVTSTEETWLSQQLRLIVYSRQVDVLRKGEHHHPGGSELRGAGSIAVAGPARIQDHRRKRPFHRRNSQP